ncbi:hypothetical protein F5050DRAFT_1903677 [Lentinula boryana]|uniref:Uncharacterized protein n=1 Tax=Lentinula boryana TaxID=40481 RepID=A0ABQ8Q997_9AGAR|nr:hypothetical protein F5050DRAFT_1903677 [Lentinula boryana]
MITGAEFSIALTLASKIISTLSTERLKNRTDEILGDHNLADLMGELYELNEKQAKKQNRKWDKACEKIKLLEVSRAPKYMLFRYSTARSAYSLAKSYEVNVKKDTAFAKLQAYKRNVLQKQKEKENIEDAQTRNHPTEEDPTYRHIVRSSSTIVFDYSPPVGTPENPAIHCPVGSELTIPEGLKPGNIMFYSSSQTSSHPYHASSHHSDISMGGDESVDNASELIAETNHLAEILVSINNSNASIATTFYNFDDIDETGSDCGGSGDLTGNC